MEGEESKQPSQWSKIARDFNAQNILVNPNATKRDGRQCREKWINKLSPNSNKGKWSASEDILIL